MPPIRNREDDADDLDDRDDPLESDQDEPGSSEDLDVVACPFCGRSVVESADICPHCHNFISHEATAARKPPWIWIAAGAALLGLIGWRLILLFGWLKS